MKRFLILVGSIALAATQLAWAQPGRPPSPDGAVGRAQEERRGPREDFRREQVERRQERASGEQVERRQERGSGEQPGGRHMSPDERRELRQQIRDHGRSIYRERQ